MAAYEMRDNTGEWFGSIPVDWSILPLKYAFSIKKDIAGKPGYTVLSVTQKGIKPKDMLDKGQFAMDYSKYQLVNRGEFIMNHMDLLTGWVDIAQEPGVTSPDYRVFYNTDPAQFSSEYYKYIFQFCYSTRIFYGMGQGVAGFGRWRLPSNMFLHFLLPVPSIDEQTAIAAYLDERCALIDEAIAEAKACIEEYKDWKASVIFETVTKGFDKDAEMKESGIEWIGMIPTHWGRAKVRQFAVFFNGDRTSRYPKPEDFVNEGIPFLNSSNIDNDFVDTTDCKYITQEKYASLSGAKLQCGDIVYCLRGSVGKCAVNNHLNEGTIASSLTIIRPISMNREYLLYCLLSDVARHQTAQFTNGTCAANLSAENVSNYVIPVPPIREQAIIAAHIKNLSQQVLEIEDEKQNLISDLESFKRSLIFEVVTGKRKVVQ